MADEAHDQGDEPSQTKPEFELPDGYVDETAFLSEMRQLFYDDIQFDQLNREAALEDLRFAVGDQWEDSVRQRREAARKPVLTINQLALVDSNRPGPFDGKEGDGFSTPGGKAHIFDNHLVISQLRDVSHHPGHDAKRKMFDFK